MFRIAILLTVLWLALVIASPALAAQNELTPEEREQGWILLFDGRTTDGWMTPKQRPLPLSHVQGGCLNPHPCDYMLVHEKRWSNFVLSLEFKISPGCNSGVFFRTSPLTPRPGKDVGFNGIELAVDDTETAGFHDTGAIYDLVKPKTNAMKPAGQWNQMVLACVDNMISITLNDELVTEMNLDEWTEPGKRPDGSTHKFSETAYKHHPRSGYIGLQDHGRDCWYRNIKLRPLKRDDARIDFDRARQLLRKQQNGEQLSDDEKAYLQRARETRRVGRGGNAQTVDRRTLPPSESTGLIPLDEMSVKDRYFDEDGGLYGRGMNQPPRQHRQAAERALSMIQPLSATGEPADDGRIVLVSISMSNATQEFSRFKQIADKDPHKSPRLTIVDCAQGGQAMAEWVKPDAPPWLETARRLQRANVTPQQVQVAWIKLANKGPRGDLQQHGRKLQQDTLAVIQNAKKRFPNLRIAYLSSRIYGGYSGGPLNPEPFAYESAFSVRWLIQDQIQGNLELNYNSAGAPTKPVKAPLLLWGPYLWADGVTPRSSDALTWQRENLGRDGTHPSQSGRDKVARMLLTFFKDHPLAKSWFVGSPD